MSSNDFDLMFGRLALRLQLINASQLKSVEQLAANQPTAGFAALMLAQGLITVSQRNEVQQRVDQLVSAYNGDVEKVLIAIEEVGPSPASADDSGAFEATVIGAPTIVAVRISVIFSCDGRDIDVMNSGYPTPCLSRSGCTPNCMGAQGNTTPVACPP